MPLNKRYKYRNPLKKGLDIVELQEYSVEAKRIFESILEGLELTETHLRSLTGRMQRNTGAL